MRLHWQRGPLAPSDHVGPERKFGAREIAPQHIQSLMPVVELFVVGALEARASQPECLQIVPGQGANDTFSDVSGVRDVLARVALTRQSYWAARVDHPTTTLVREPSPRPHSVARWPRLRGRSSASGL